MKAELHATFPHFGNVLLEQIELSGRSVLLPEGASIKASDIGANLPIVLSGSVKVLENIRGQYFLLFRALPSESAALPPTSNDREIRLVADMDSQLVLIPETSGRNWMCTFPSWRSFKEKADQAIMKKLLDTLWHSGDCLENRILAYLEDLRRIHRSGELQVTHSGIAEEIGSVREVVSRSLKKLEQEGKVQLMRGKIIVY